MEEAQEAWCALEKQEWEWAGVWKKKLREPEKNKLTNTKMKLDGEEM